MANILVIDQDAAVRGLFQTVLESAGHAVVLAANADEGYEVLRSSRIEMAIVDINMSNGTGLEVLSVVQHDFPATRVLGILGEAIEYDPLQAGWLLREVEILLKPLGVSQLLETVNRVLGSPHKEGG